MNENHVELHALLGLMQGDGTSLSLAGDSVRSWTKGIISGGVVVFGQSQGALSVATVCDWLVESLDIVFRAEFVAAAEDFVTSYFRAGERAVIEDQVVLRNVFEASAELLEGREIFNRVAEYSRTILVTENSLSTDVKTEAARFLFNSGRLGVEPQFWENLCKDPSTVAQFLPTAVLALMEKWPSEGLRLLFREGVALSEADQAHLANFVSLSWDDITARVTADEYAREYLAYKGSLSRDFGAAIEAAARLRGWNLPEEHQRLEADVGGPADRLPALQVAVGSEVVDIVDIPSGGGDVPRRIEILRQRAVKLAQEIHFTQKTYPKMNGAGPFPGLQREMLAKISSARRANGVDRETAGLLELGLVREFVKIEIEDQVERDDFQEPEVLLDAVEECLPHFVLCPRSAETAGETGL